MAARPLTANPIMSVARLADDEIDSGLASRLPTWRLEDGALTRVYRKLGVRSRAELAGRYPVS